MKTSTPPPPSRRRMAFTLIELLVVVAVIAILAALIFPITGALKKQRTLKVAQAELAQIETAIEAYKSRLGHYPPDNPNPTLPGFLINQLYYELAGTIQTNLGGAPTYVTRDGGGQILASQLGAAGPFGAPVAGFVNSSTSAKGDDEKQAAENFLRDLKPNQTAELPGTTPSVKVLTCSILLDPPHRLFVTDPVGINPWRYISTNPTNNPNSYDLWVDVVLNSKTNRVSNWSKAPQVLP